MKGSNSIRYYGPIIWSLVLEEIRYAHSQQKFKNKIKRWNPNDCSCHICKSYIPVNVAIVKVTSPLLDF